MDVFEDSQELTSDHMGNKRSILTKNIYCTDAMGLIQKYEAVQVLHAINNPCT